MPIIIKMSFMKKFYIFCSGLRVHEKLKKIVWNPEAIKNSFKHVYLGMGFWFQTQTNLNSNAKNIFFLSFRV